MGVGQAEEEVYRAWSRCVATITLRDLEIQSVLQRLLLGKRRGGNKVARATLQFSLWNSVWENLPRVVCLGLDRARGCDFKVGKKLEG